MAYSLVLDKLSEALVKYAVAVILILSLVILGVIDLWVAMSHAQESDYYTITPTIPDYNPAPDALDEGGFFNPYIVEGDRGDTWEISPTFPDTNPNDRWMKPGSTENPWTIQRRR